jgi:hypothetical protein
MLFSAQQNLLLFFYYLTTKTATDKRSWESKIFCPRDIAFFSLCSKGRKAGILCHNVGTEMAPSKH